MIGLGTIINVAAVIVGGLLGLVFGKLLKENVQESLIKAMGIAVIFLGIGGCMEKMLTAGADGIISTGGSMMMILSLMLGTVVGEILGLEHQIERFGSWLKVKTGSSGEKRFIEGFVTTSLTICIGAMAIIGAIEDGINGNYSILAAKAVLDCVVVLLLTSSLGKGCIFAAIPVAILQGLVTILARVIEPVMTEAALNNLSYVGNILICCVGINLVWNLKLRVANMLPSIVFAVIAAFIPFFG